MKKLSVLLICALGIVAFSSCDSKPKVTPGEMAKKHHEHLKNHDYHGYANCFYYGEILSPIEIEGESDDIKVAQKQMAKESHATALKKNIQPAIEKKGGIKDVTVKSEQVSPDKKTADVVLINTFNNGEKEEISYKMILDEGDQLWKVKMGPHKEVWKVHTPDGKRESFKLLDYHHKDVTKIHDDGERDFIKEKDTENRDVFKVKEDGEKEVVKIIDRKDETVIKVKEDGEKTKTRIPKEEKK